MPIETRLRFLSGRRCPKQQKKVVPGRETLMSRGQSTLGPLLRRYNMEKKLGSKFRAMFSNLRFKLTRESLPAKKRSIDKDHLGIISRAITRDLSRIQGKVSLVVLVIFEGVSRLQHHFSCRNAQPARKTGLSKTARRAQLAPDRRLALGPADQEIADPFCRP